MTERILSQVQLAEMGFLRKVHDVTMGVRRNFSRGQRHHFADLSQVDDDAIQIYVRETLYLYYTTKEMPMLQSRTQIIRFVVMHSQVHSDNFHNRLSANFSSGILIFTEVLPWSLTNPQIMTLFYLARLVSTVATGTSLVNIRLLPSSISDFYVTDSNKLNTSFIST